MRKPLVAWSISMVRSPSLPPPFPPSLLLSLFLFFILLPPTTSFSLPQPPCFLSLSLLCFFLPFFPCPPLHLLYQYYFLRSENPFDLSSFPCSVPTWVGVGALFFDPSSPLPLFPSSPLPLFSSSSWSRISISQGCFHFFLLPFLSFLGLLFWSSHSSMDVDIQPIILIYCGEC